jgi:putative nucleotidyltransferase-like protein
VAAVERGEAGLISEELERDSSNGKEEIAAFAISTQGLSALVAKGAGIEALPAPLSQFLYEEISRAGARARRLRATLVEAIQALRAVGVEAVALKGAALAFFHYEESSLRPMGDLDLLLDEPRDLERATSALVGAGWTALFDTPRHRVFARPDERVVRPASEDPGNPIRLEIHSSFRLPVLGCVYDASAELRAQAETRDLEGAAVAIAAGPSLVRHLLFHAAEDFAGNGIRGIQAHDFRLLARAGGRLAPEIPEISKASSNERERKSGAFEPRDRGIPSNEKSRRRGLAPLLYAVDAIQRLFPLTFEELFLSSLSSRVLPELRRRAAFLPALRYTRPPRGWTRTLLTLVEGPLPKARFLARTVLPGLGEVRANAAPNASGVGLAAAWIRILVRRIGTALGGRA